MIINVPIYLEFDGRFTPQEGKELTLLLRRKLNEFVRQKSGGSFTMTFDNGRTLKVEVISETQAVNRFASGKRVIPDSLQEGTPKVEPK